MREDVSNENNINCQCLDRKTRRNKDFFGQNVKKLAIGQPMVAHHSILFILYVEIQTPEETNFIYTKKDKFTTIQQSKKKLHPTPSSPLPTQPITSQYY